MKKVKKDFKARERLIFIIVFSITFIFATCCLVECTRKYTNASNGLEQAMMAFKQAMISGDNKGILAAFSRTTAWRFVSYEIGTGRRLYTKTVIFSRMESDFKAHKGWWHFFIGKPVRDPNYVENFTPNIKWLRQGTTFLVNYNGPGKPIINYIKWRQEGKRWVIAEIGLPAV